MVGVEIDISLAIGIVSAIFPFTITLPATYLFRHYFREQEHNGAFFAYLAAALSKTSFMLLTRIITELKLVTAEIRRITLLSTAVNGLLSLVPVELVVATTGVKGENGIMSARPSPYLVCVFLVQPGLKWFVRRTPEGEPMSDMDLGIVIMGVMMAGYVTDFIGVSSGFGHSSMASYSLVGPMAPHWSGGWSISQGGLLLPIYFGNSGFRTDLFEIQHASFVTIIVFLFILSSVAKVLASSLTSLSLDMPLPQGISLGVRMNTQGLTELVLLNITRDKDVRISIKALSTEDSIC